MPHTIKMHRSDCCHTISYTTKKEVCEKEHALLPMVKIHTSPLVDKKYKIVWQKQYIIFDIYCQENTKKQTKNSSAFFTVHNQMVWFRLKAWSR